MENKYFIPDISDFHNGYEYEKNDGGEWYSVTCDLYDARDIKTLLNKKVLDTFPEGKSPLDSDTYSVHHKATDIDRIRVPHLTKEQIEAEGWEFETVLFADDNENDVYSDGFAKHIDENHWYEMVLREDNKIHIVYKWYRNSVGQIWRDVYYGECKCINQFRKIIKLLEI